MRAAHCDDARFRLFRGRRADGFRNHRSASKAQNPLVSGPEFYSPPLLSASFSVIFHPRTTESQVSPLLPPDNFSIEDPCRLSPSRPPPRGRSIRLPFGFFRLVFPPLSKTALTSLLKPARRVMCRSFFFSFSVASEKRCFLPRLVILCRVRLEKLSNRQFRANL